MDTTRPSLLLRIRDHADAEAWQTFDTIYRPLIYRYALAQGLADPDADDVTQYCLSAVAERIATFDYDPRKGSFKGWLRTIATNRVRNLWRDRRDRPAASGELQRPQEREPEPDEVFERIWQQEHLWHCLREVERDSDQSTYRAFVAYVLENETVEAVCAKTGLTRNNVYTIKWRLTERIAQRMKELLDGTE